MRTLVRVSIVLGLLGVGLEVSAQRGVDVEQYGGAGGDDVASSPGRRRGLRTSRQGAVPAEHRVRRGDTLWDISGHYFGNPWEWPRVWSYNPEITNPHWIYPDDRVRLEGGSVAAAELPSSSASVRPAAAPEAGGAPSSFWLREQGFLDRAEIEGAGVVVGSPEERMLLSTYDPVYVQFESGYEPTPGAEYTIFARIDASRHVESEQGELVRILGTVRIDSYDTRERLGRGMVTQAYDPIERGYRVAPMDRSIRNVPPRVNDRDLEARVVATLQPRELLASGQIVFLDVGIEDGVRVGNRFFILRAGDGWRDTNIYRGLDRGEAVRDSPTPSDYPDEIIAEGRVVSVRAKTATVLVSEARVDVAIGERAELRRGF